MTTPTPERLATLTRFHAQCRPDAECETCEVLAVVKVSEKAMDFLRKQLSLAVCICGPAESIDSAEHAEYCNFRRIFPVPAL